MTVNAITEGELPAAVFYSDGLTEARDRHRGPHFGADGLARALAATHGAGAAQTLERLREAASAHSGGHADDDTAMLLVRVTP